MKNPALRSNLIKVFVKLGITLLILISLVFLIAWFYVSPVMLENKAARFVRKKMDVMFHEAYLADTLGFRRTATKYSPWMYAWRPPRIIPDMKLPSAFDGNTEFNTIFGQVASWYPEKNMLGVIPFTYTTNYSILYVDVSTAKIIIPEFDQTGQPMPFPPVDEKFITPAQATNFANSFATNQEMEEFKALFDSTENLNAFVTTYFNGLNSRIQLFDYSGPYTWDTAFCIEDIVILGFAKDVELTKLGSNEYPEADVVNVNLSSCPVNYGGGTQ